MSELAATSPEKTEKAEEKAVVEEKIAKAEDDDDDDGPVEVKYAAECKTGEKLAKMFKKKFTR